jgi:AcrR family transcriptional regulator
MTGEAGIKRARAAAQAQRHEDDDRTRARILRTAERLFAAHGYNGVSVRDLAAAAQVNIASIGYHFDSKEGLLSEVYRRHCEPLIEERLRGLAAAGKRRGKARVAAIIEAFIRPALAQVEAEDGETFIRLRAVLSGENSELLEQLVAENFDQSSTAFIDALCECLPQITRTEICWRFHFLLGAIYYTAAGPHRIHAFSHGRCDPADTEAVIAELVPFMTRAFCAPMPAAAKAGRARRRAPRTKR